MLEAASRLIERDGLDALNTNRIAELAGVSIGSLYQYFPDKHALLAALARREIAAVSQQVLAVLAGPAPAAPGDRVRAIVRAVFGVFGARSQVQRQLLERALGPGTALPGNMTHGLITALLSGAGVTTHDGGRRQLTTIEAFVLTQAFAGVVRAALIHLPEPKDRQAIEEALVRLVLGFFAGAGAPGAPARQSAP
ncbi:TetR/AcrR family transcriptional regulator [Noviherbaspirillum pedocola]|nr:TetR/AcrR family transcriptional regulator [Noviherbaspirillum pedocola]